MAPFTPQNLFSMLRECGLYKPDELAALDAISPETLADFPALADTLHAAKLVTPYQARKVRVNRLHEVMIGPYLVLDKIGEGGMGKVYKAVHCVTKKTVALKVVRAHLMSNPTVMRRYKREAAAAAKLNHPNIVSLLDADEAQGRYFLALEYVYGSDLSRMVKEFGQLPSQEAAEYIRQAALGLQHAHENNLIHRDIKPSNLLVSGSRAGQGDGGVATVRILDMGLVRSLIEEEDASRTELTRDGTVVGTPDYMAPEQAKNSSTVDHRADIYSLGCTLYYLLKGKPPFPDGSPIDKLLRHQLDPHPDLRKDRPDVPFDMHRLVDRMLAKKPEDRIQSAAEVAKLLEQFTAEGLAKSQDIVLTLPDPAPKPAIAAAVVVPDGSTITTVPVKVLEAEVVETRPAAAKPVAIGSKKPVKLVPRDADSADSFPQYGSGNNPRRRDADSDEDSFPRPDDETRGRSKETEAALATKRRMAKARLAEKKRKKKPNWMPIAAIGGGVALLAIIAAVFFLKPPPKPQPSAPEVNNVPPPPVVKGLPPAWANVPDNATAVVVAHPDAFWLAARDHVPSRSRFARVMNDLTNRYHFDLRKGERFTFASLGGRAGVGIATVEGDFLTPEWAAQAEKGDGVKPTAVEDRKLLAFPSIGSFKMYGLAGGGRAAYSIANSDGLAIELGRRKSAQKPAIPDAMLAALADASGPNPPTFTFVATGRLTFAEGLSLGELGAEFVVLNARLVGDRFDVDVDVRGNSKERVIEFVNDTLWKKVNKSHPVLKPALVSILSDTSDVGWDRVDNLDRLRKTQSAAWTMADVQKWLEQLLPAD